MPFQVHFAKSLRLTAELVPRHIFRDRDFNNYANTALIAASDMSIFMMLSEIKKGVYRSLVSKGHLLALLSND